MGQLLPHIKSIWATLEKQRQYMKGSAPVCGRRMSKSKVVISKTSQKGSKK